MEKNLNEKKIWIRKIQIKEGENISKSQIILITRKKGEWKKLSHWEYTLFIQLQ